MAVANTLAYPNLATISTVILKKFCDTVIRNFLQL
jgi:hypothetical protein